MSASFRPNSDQQLSCYDFCLCTFVHLQNCSLRKKIGNISPPLSTSHFYYWISFLKVQLQKSAVITPRHKKVPHSNTLKSKITPPEYWWRGKIRTRKQISQYYILLQSPWWAIWYYFMNKDGVNYICSIIRKGN